MTDRTSAGIFGAIFWILAEGRKSNSKRDAAHKIWAEARGYDFSPCDMYADEALIKLGLAREVPVKGSDGEDPDDWREIIYFGEPRF